MLEPVTPGFLAPGAQRKEAREQVSAQGEVIVPLDEDSVRRAAAELVSDGVQAIAVCYLFSFLHPQHERRTRELIEAAHPGIAVSLSSDVDPTFREYERTVVTAFDAYMKPVVGRYLERLEDGLRAAHVTAPLQIMQSRGGLAGTSVARKRPVRLFLSGPAAGVIGGAIVGRSSGHRDVITIDVGGTSSDIALVEGGEPVIRAQGSIARLPGARADGRCECDRRRRWFHRLARWRRRLARRPAFRRLRTRPRLLRPRRRGRDGHRCVRRAGLARSRLSSPAVPSEARSSLARGAIERRIAQPLGLSVEDAALGIHRVVNAQMVEGIRLVSIRRGFDPRRFTLVALGGAGPIHATALAPN